MNFNATFLTSIVITDQTVPWSLIKFINEFIIDTIELQTINLSCLPLGQMFGRALPVGQYDPVGHT